MTQIQTKQSILKLIKEAEAQFSGTGKALLDIEDYVAEYLTANSVIVLPCKVGQTVYLLDIFADNCKCADCDCYYAGGMGDSPECEKTKDGYRYHKCIEIIEQPAIMQAILSWLSWDDFGKTVFLSREDAEKVLAERSKE